jgi:hypothetical protein
VFIRALPFFRTSRPWRLACNRKEQTASARKN